MEKTYTIIVPMYNVQPYISECIESVIAQTYPNWELIIVDDESKDDSLKIARQYAEMDSRIKIIVKKHGGLPQTRNYGLREATGDYIVLLDGDDYLSAEHLEKCNNILDNDSDMCIFNNHVNFTKELENKIVLFPVYDGINKLSKKDKLDIIFSLDNRLPAAAVLTVYRRNFLLENNIEYSEQYRCSEDLDFFLNNLIFAKRILFADHVFYYYRQDNTTAMTKNISADMLLDRLSIYEKWYHFYKNKNIDEFDGNTALKLLKRDMRTSVLLYHQISKCDLGREKLKSYIYCSRDIWQGVGIRESFFYIMKFKAVTKTIRNSFHKIVEMMRSN